MCRAAISCKKPVVLLLLVLGHSVIASAHLSGDFSSVRADAQAMHASVRSTALLSYDIHELQDGAGLTVREYVTRAGGVFAVSWRGAIAPDLQQLLGQHFLAYAAAVSSSAHPGLRRSMRLVTEPLVLQLSGRSRAYTGYAYVPRLLPADFDVHLLR